MLGRLGDPERAVETLLKLFELMKEKPLVIEKPHFERALDTSQIAAAREQEAVPLKRAEPDAPEPVKVLFGRESVSINGTIDDFKRYFNDRFDRLEKILRSRADINNASTISNIPHGDRWRKVKAIGMVTSKRDFKDGTTQVELEDPADSVRVTFRSDEALKNKAARLMIDEVVCITGGTKTGKSIVADDIIWPEISFHSHGKAPAQKTYAVLTSDVHLGSKMFMQEEFEYFIRWLRGEEGDFKSREIAQSTKYLIIAGDLVDGVGIYPNQEEELAITDLYEQYAKAAEYLAAVPDSINIVIIPGNHDACRPTLPTPPIYREYAGPIYDLKNVTMLGDPAEIMIDGATLLLTHGRSLDDTIPAIPGCDFKNPQKAMVELLRSRHIAPIYGEKTPLAPEPRDRLVIETIPDIFHAGHVHVEGIAEYKGVLAVNSGTWQGQTKFQLSMGIVPKAGIVPVVDLSTMKFMELNFNFA
jgi:DNA polymerase II small subunit